MAEPLDIHDVAAGVTLIEACGPAVAPRWITGRAGRGRTKGLAEPGRNPFHGWASMPDVQVRSFRLHDVVLDADTMVLMQHGRIIRQTDYHRSAAELAALRVDPGRLTTVAAGSPVLICGDAWSANHYHWLNHTLPAIDTAIARLGPAGIRLATLPVQPTHEAALALLGHAVVARLTLQPGRQYALPEAEFCAYTTGVADFAVSATIQAIHDRIVAALPAAGRGAASRIYVSRLGSTHRRMRSEPQLIDRLARRGFTIIDPGRATLAEQVAQFQAADLVVAPHGAALANIAFCRPSAQVYELVPSHFANPCMLALCLRRGARAWADGFDSQGEGPDFLRDWDLDVDYVCRRVDEIEDCGRRRWWRPGP